MAYYMPIKMLQVGPDFSIPIHRIVIIGSIESYNIQQLISEHKKKKTLISCSGKKPTKSAVIMDNGAVITSSYTEECLRRKINELQTYDMMTSEIRTVTRNKKTKKEDIDVEEIMRKLGIENGEGEEEESGTEAEEDN